MRVLEQFKAFAAVKCRAIAFGEEEEDISESFKWYMHVDEEGPALASQHHV